MAEQPNTNMTIYTIGYGGRRAAEFVELLTRHGVRSVVDVRLRPDRASMGAYALAKSPEKGIQGLLAKAGIRYVSLVELGNLFLDRDDWQDAYRRLLAAAGDVLTERLFALQLTGPICFMCAEKEPERCHRALLGEHLAKRGYDLRHIV